jgi:hypothetical protein
LREPQNGPRQRVFTSLQACFRNLPNVFSIRIQRVIILTLIGKIAEIPPENRSAPAP